MHWFRKFKKSLKSPKYPVSSASSTQDVATDPPGSGAGPALDTHHEGPTNGSSLTPLPKRKEGNQGTPMTSTPGEGGDVVEREHGAHSGDKHVQIDQKSDPREGLGPLVQQPRELVPESTFGSNQGVRDVYKDEVGEEQKQKLPTLEVGTSCVAVGATEHRNNRIVPSTFVGDFGNNGEEPKPEGASKVAKKIGKDTLPGNPKRSTEGFGLLKAILDDILAVYGTIAVESSIKNILPRIIALEEHFDSRPGDVAEHRRREELIRKLSGVEGQLRMFSDKWGSQRPPDCTQDHEAVLSLFEDLQEAIFNYKVAQRKAICDRELKRIGPAEVAVINSFRCAKQAEYLHGDRSHCLKGTRREILDEIQSWTHDFTGSPVYWLNGLAGTGKSTIAQTVAENSFADGRLGASFFCSRDFEDRSDPKFILPTLAVQLARTYADFRSIFVPLVQLNPEIAYESLHGQMEKLLVQPLMESGISTVIVIDALDECKDEENASTILSVLGQFVVKIPKVKFFLTSRPETRIREGIRLQPLVEATDVFILHGVQPDHVSNDVRQLFVHNFSGPGSGRRGPDGWPTEEQLSLLCERAGGLFVHAMATIRFVNQANKNPKRQLDRLLQFPESSTFEGKTRFKGTATLDSLYSSILQEAFDDDDPEHDQRARSVLGAVILAANPLSPAIIAALLGFDIDDVFPPLLSVSSLLVFQEDAGFPVRPFHKSFPDFITDPVRCINPRFRVCPPDQHAELLAGCLELMNRKLERNMCKLPDGVMNSEVGDLEERIEEQVDRALQYACRSWHKHLVDTVPVHIIPILHHFLEKNFLFWLEVLSVLGAAREAVDALGMAAKLLDDSPTLNLVKDYLRFVIAFFEVISTSAPHIYHSALPLSPRTSTVHETYERYAHPLGRVVQGLPISWKRNFTTVYDEEFEGEVAWSPCSRFIAVAKTRAVEVLDAVTLKRLNKFESPTNPATPLLSFSPDSCYLTQIGDGRLTRWDLQTGNPLGSIVSRLDAFPMDPFSSTYSADGRALAVAWRTRPDNDTFIATYDLVSMAHTRSYHLPGMRIIAPIWTCGECLRFATVKPGMIAIREAQFTLTPEPAEVETWPAPDEIADGENFLFLPTTRSQLAFTLRGSIFVWDVKYSRFTLKSGPIQASEPTQTPSSPRFSSRSSFSSDGGFFACMTVDREVYVWLSCPSSELHYSLYQQLPFATAIVRSKPLLSPSGESIIASIGPTIHLWDPREQILSNNDVGGQKNFSMTLSPNKTLAAFTWEQRQTVTVLDIKSSEPRLIIDTEEEVLCLGMTDDTVVLAFWEKIVTWKIPTKKCTLDSRANINDSVRTTRLCQISGRYIPHASLSPDLSRGVFLVVPNFSPGIYDLVIFNVSTGKKVAKFSTGQNVEPLWTRDGRQIWGVCGSSVNGWEVGLGSKHHLWEPKYLTPAECPSDIIPWRSSRGYKVADGWVLSPTQKRLLWLPHYWRSCESDRMWSGRFLGLLYRGLPEVVILEFLD